MTCRIIEPYEAIDFRRWIGLVKVRECSGEVYECYWLKLPSYGYHWDFMRRRDVWCQLVLFWHGRDGLNIQWEPCPAREPA